MLAKLIAILAHAKGAVVTTVLLAGAATATVTVSSNPEVQTTFDNVTTSLSSTLSAVTQNAKRCVGDEDANDGGQPEVVAQRNAADKLLRDAWQNDHKKLTDLRGGKNIDVKSYQDQLKDRLDTALNDVAALTLGREGQVRKAEASANTSAKSSRSPKPSESPEGSKSPKPSCSPAPAAAPAAASSPKPSESPKASGSGKPDVQGRVAVANRTTLTADIKSIVDKAIKDMDDLTKKATDEAAKLPAVAPKNEDKGKPSDKPGNGNKASASPRA